MPTFLRSMLQLLDRTLHPEVKHRGGMPMLRARMLSAICLLLMVAAGGIIWGRSTTVNDSLNPLFVWLILAQSFGILILNRLTDQTSRLAGFGMFFTSVLVAMGISRVAQSVFAPGFLWFSVLIMPNFLLCGRRIGLIVSLFMIAVALVTISYCQRFGLALPFDNDLNANQRMIALTLLLSNTLMLAVVCMYFYLLRLGEKNREEQRDWVQSTARMQELLQMSKNFALQTNGPLDILGTALHNMEDRMQNSLQPRNLLPLLEPVESSIQDLAGIARSFSLFSRRYLEEGWDLVSINAIFQHAETISNIGFASSNSRLLWKKIEPDLLIHTQTAKMVMLIISILRSMEADGGTQLHAEAAAGAGGLVMALQHHMAAVRIKRQTGSGKLDETRFDHELNEDLIRELCLELGIQCSKTREGHRLVYRLKLSSKVQPQAVA